jgi:hypothetical protein
MDKENHISHGFATIFDDLIHCVAVHPGKVGAGVSLPV